MSRTSYENDDGNDNDDDNDDEDDDGVKLISNIVVYLQALLTPACRRWCVRRLHTGRRYVQDDLPRPRC